MTDQRENGARSSRTGKPITDASILVSTEKLKEFLLYCPETGIFTRKVTSRCGRYKAGDAIGKLTQYGYLKAKVEGKCYLMHRLAWFYVHGKWPLFIDHKNGVRTDNRIDNLRDTTQAINNQNVTSPRKDNRSGYIGVKTHASGKFQANIRVNGRRLHIGTFHSAEAAHEAYVTTKRKYHEGCTL